MFGLSEIYRGGFVGWGFVGWGFCQWGFCRVGVLSVPLSIHSLFSEIFLTDYTLS